MVQSLTCRHRQMRSWRLQGCLSPSSSLESEILSLTKWTSLTLITNHFIPRVPSATKQEILCSLFLTEISPMIQQCLLRKYSRKSQTSWSNTSKRKISSQIRQTHNLDSRKQLKQQWMPRLHPTSEVSEWPYHPKKTGMNNKNLLWSKSALAWAPTQIKFERSSTPLELPISIQDMCAD